MKEFPVIDITSMTLESLQQLEQTMITEGIQLEGALHSLTSIGGVSRAYAEGFSDYLPEGIALESFTPTVTKTQHGVALESLGLAIGFVAGVGLVAVLGGVYILMKKLAERSLKPVKVKVINTINKAFAEMPKAVDQFRSEYQSIASDAPDNAVAQKAIDEIASEIKSNDALLGILQSGEAKYIHTVILSGDYTPVSTVIGSKISREIDALVTYLDQHVLSLLDKAVSRGGACTLEEIAEIDGKLKSSPPFGLRDEVHSWSEKNNIKSSPNDFTGPFKDFRQNWFKNVDSQEIHALSNRGIKDGDLPNEQILKGFSVSQERITAVCSRIDRISKRASGDRQIPTEVTQFIRRNLESCREAVLIYNDIYSTVRRENEAITQCAEFKAEAFKATIRSLNERVVQVTDSAHRKALQDALRAIAGHYTLH